MSNKRTLVKAALFGGPGDICSEILAVENKAAEKLRKQLAKTADKEYKGKYAAHKVCACGNHIIKPGEDPYKAHQDWAKEKGIEE